MTQKQIDSVLRRSLKPSYKILNPQEKKLIKLREQEAILEKDLQKQWRIIYFHQKPPYLPESTPSNVQEMLNFVLLCTERLEKIRKSKDRLIEKHGLDENKIADLHLKYNTGRLGNSSF